MNITKFLKRIITASFISIAGITYSYAIYIPRPEYPRPQFERSDWVNLNGIWTYEFDFGESGKERNLQKSIGFEKKITVPFCPESELSGVEYKDFINRMWYHRKLDIPAEWKGKKILLNFGAVDYCAEIFIDGEFIDRHYGGSSSFAVDITRYVTPGQSHNLVVHVKDDLKTGLQTGGKQSTSFYSHGCLYTRVTGIWQTVWMEAVEKHGLKRVYTRPDIDQKQLVLIPEFYNESNNCTFEVTLLNDDKIIEKRKTTACNNSIITIPVRNIKLWTPEDPFLYDIIYKVIDSQGNVIDEVHSYVGMRKVHTENGMFFLNNKPYYQRLVLDQGYYPDGIWTASSDEALKNDILLGKEAGFNGARLHQKVFEERYYYWADKLGYLTWGESASWGLNVNNEIAARNFISEWTEIVTRDRNHPSLVIWTPFNETWNGGDDVYIRLVKDVYNITKATDPTRPINDASGDSHVITDIWSVHNYEQDGNKLKKQLEIEEGKEPYRNIRDKKYLAIYEGQPYMLDEFGGIPWMPEKDRKDSWGYGSMPSNEKDFYKRLEGQIDALIESKHVCGFCYTQLTDVEQEKNGIYTYERKSKFDIKRIKAIFEKLK